MPSRAGTTAATAEYQPAGRTAAVGLPAQRLGASQTSNGRTSQIGLPRGRGTHRAGAVRRTAEPAPRHQHELAAARHDGAGAAAPSPSRSIWRRISRYIRPAAAMRGRRARARRRRPAPGRRGRRRARSGRGTGRCGRPCGGRRRRSARASPGRQVHATVGQVLVHVAQHVGALHGQAEGARRAHASSRVTPRIAVISSPTAPATR